MEKKGKEGGEDLLSLKMFPPNDAQFAEEGEGDQGVGSANSQVAGDFLKLAQTSFQLSCDVVCKKTDIWSYSQTNTRLNAQVDRVKLYGYRNTDWMEGGDRHSVRARAST